MWELMKPRWDNQIYANGYLFFTSINYAIQSGSETHKHWQQQISISLNDSEEPWLLFVVTAYQNAVNSKYTGIMPYLHQITLFGPYKYNHTFNFLILTDNLLVGISDHQSIPCLYQLLQVYPSHTGRRIHQTSKHKTCQSRSSQKRRHATLKNQAVEANEERSRTKVKINATDV